MNLPRIRTLAALAAGLALAGCSMFAKEPAAVNDAIALEATAWRLVSVPAGVGGGVATLRFEGDGFSIDGPCNRHRGNWDRVGERLRFGGERSLIASTKKACPEPMMARESALLAALRQPLTVTLQGPYLDLVAADGSTWRFDGRDQPPSEGRELIVHVAGQRVPCTGVAPTLCLQVRLQPGAAWQPHYGEIAGFDWQVGVEYVIRVHELPGDGALLQWKLEEVLQRSR